jgi:hypothetical protein
MDDTTMEPPDAPLQKKKYEKKFRASNILTIFSHSGGRMFQRAWVEMVLYTYEIGLEFPAMARGGCLWRAQ